MKNDEQKIGIFSLLAAKGLLGLRPPFSMEQLQEDKVVALLLLDILNRYFVTVLSQFRFPHQYSYRPHDVKTTVNIHKYLQTTSGRSRNVQ